MKRLVAFALTAALTVGLMPTAFAAPKDVPLPEKEAVLQELEIMEGDGTGALHLERNITRGVYQDAGKCLPIQRKRGRRRHRSLSRCVPPGLVRPLCPRSGGCGDW